MAAFPIIEYSERCGAGFFFFFFFRERAIETAHKMADFLISHLTSELGSWNCAILRCGSSSQSSDLSLIRCSVTVYHVEGGGGRGVDL